MNEDQLQCWKCKRKLTINRFSIPGTDICDKCHLDQVRLEWELEEESNKPGGWRYEDRIREIEEGISHDEN